MPLFQFVLTHGKNPFINQLSEIELEQLAEIIDILRGYIDVPSTG